MMLRPNPRRYVGDLRESRPTRCTVHPSQRVSDAVREPRCPDGPRTLHPGIAKHNVARLKGAPSVAAPERQATNWERSHLLSSLLWHNTFGAPKPFA
jgi:hypothetical protein